jgi:uncharacterized protein YndB with AHSA1/START domain
VWEYLATAEHLPGWFGDGVIEPRVGGAVTLMKGQIRGTVTRWRANKQLAYSWNVFSPGEEESTYPESYVTLDLEARGDSVLLRLTHFPVLERFEMQNAMGWHSYLDMLGAAVRGDRVEERSVYMRRNAALYDIDLSNLVR